MTVPSATSRSGPYNGNGATTSFAYGFRILNAAHLRVVLRNAAGVETVQTLTTNYTVAGVGDATGTITMLVPPATGETLVILRNAPFKQETDLQNQGAFFSETIEEGLDLLTMQTQELNEKLNRAVLMPENSTLAPPRPDVIETVAGIAGNVSTVAGIASEVVTVAGVSSDVAAVGQNIGAVLAAPGHAAAAAAARDASEGFRDEAEAFAASAGSTILTSVAFTQAGADATTSTVQRKLQERVSVFDFMTEPEINGVVMRTGTASLSAAIQKALDATVTNGAALYFPSGQYAIGTSLTVTGTGVTLVGDGVYKTHFVPASGSTATQLFNFDGSCLYAHFERMSIVTDGFATRAVTVAENATVIRFENSLFQGDLSGDLVKSRGQNVEFHKCTFHPTNRDTWGLHFEDFNQNGAVTSCRFGLTGSGARVTSTSTSIRPEGIKFVNNYWINTGEYNLWIGDSLLTIVSANVLDQATDSCMVLTDGALGVIATGNWFGLRYYLDGTASITRDGTTATVTMSTAHFLQSGQVVNILGADQSEYNGTALVTVVNATTFTITVAGSPATPATGTIKIRRPGQSILVTASASIGNKIVGNFIYCGLFGINVLASASSRVIDLLIANNTFNEAYFASLNLDSVGGCRLLGNQEIGSPPGGSYNTVGTHPSKGDYQLDNNNWHPATPAVYDTASTYLHGQDTGLKSSGWASAITGASPDSGVYLAIPHGLFRTPDISKIVLGIGQASGQYSNLQVEITSVDATNILVQLWFTEVTAGTIRVNAFCSV
jgi:hypothetical protein